MRDACQRDPELGKFLNHTLQRYHHDLSLKNPIHQSLLRHVLTGSLDHVHRLYKSNLISSPICPHCDSHNETAEHIFWHCPRWHSIRQNYSTLLRLFSLVGTQWPNCFLNCGWVEHTHHYGIPLLFDLRIAYTVSNFVHDTHHMFLQILLSHHTASQILRSTPRTPTTPTCYHISPSHNCLLPFIVCTAARRGFTRFSSVQFRLTKLAQHVICEPKKNIYILPSPGSYGTTY